MNTQVKKILNISFKVVTWLLIAFTVFMMIFTITTVSTVDRNDRSILGRKFYIVQTDSMSLSENNADLDVHFNAGDIVVVKNVKDPTALEPGDIIAFLSVNSVSYGETVTHMIREVKYENGKVQGYVTYGTNTGVDDEKIVEPEYVLGVYARKLPTVGKFFAFVKSVPGYFVCILVPFLLIILWQGANTVKLFRRYKKEQMADILAERNQIAKEREESAAMLRELQALREQLARQPQEATSVNATPAEETPAEVEDTQPEKPADDSDANHD